MELIEGLATMGDPIFHTFFKFRECFTVFVFDEEAVIAKPFSTFFFCKNGAFADTANACSYLSAHDGIASARWQQFGLLLDDVARRPKTGDRMVAAAQQAFVAMKQWLRRD